MAKLGMFFKTLGTKVATLWKTTTWFKIASIGGAVVIATSAVVIPNAVISESGGIFHKCDYSVKNVDAAYSYSVANCTEKAKYYYSCACGEKGTELFEYGDTLGHDLTHHASKQITCTEIGYDEYNTCSRCDYSTYSEIPATGHTYGEWIIDADATCTEDGSKHRVCNECGTTKTEIISAKGHINGTWITDVDATCTEDGSKHQVCSICNDTINTVVISAKGHTFGNWKTTIAATCTLDGTSLRVCHCGETETKKILATGHKWSSATCETPKTCTTCNTTSGDPLGHIEGDDGYCLRCNKKMTIDMNLRVGNPNDCKTTSYFGFCYYKNSVDGIKVCWGGENLSGKTINYYSVTVYFYNSVGDPAYSEITGKSSKTIKYVGPVAPNEDLIIFGIVDYVPVCSKVLIG